MQKLKNFSLPTFGSNSTNDNTPPPLEDDLRAAVETRRAVASSLLAALTVYHSTAAKLRPDPQRSIGGSTETALPVEWVGREMLAGEDAVEALGSLPEGYAAFARTLRLVGEAQSAVGRLNESFLNDIAASVLQDLERTARDFKDYERKLKEADKLRSVVEAKMKDKKTADTEAQRIAEVEYNDVCASLARLASSLVEGIGRDQRVLEQLLDAQSDHIAQQAEVLRKCKATLATARPSLPPRSPSAKLGVPKATIRMARSHSDSAARPTRLSSPSRSPDVSGSTTPTGRRSTVGAGSADKSKAARPAIPEALKNRSRSGSMLGRFAPSAILDRRKKEKANGAYDDEDDSEADRQQHEESDLEGPDDPTAAAASSPSRFGSGLPTLGSFKNLSIGTGTPKNYGTLADDVASPTSIESASSPRRAPLKRHQTAPSLQTTSSAGRGTSPQLVEAKWRFDASDSGELTLEKGDLVQVDEEINSEWMTGRIVSTSDDGVGKSRVGKRGMFPTAFVAAALSVLGSGSYDFSGPSRRSQDLHRGADWGSLSAASSTDDSANELSEDEAAKEGLREAGTRSGTGTPRKAAPPPPPTRRRTGTVCAKASPFAD